jgi:CBS-domain-containing membrane protein
MKIDAVMKREVLSLPETATFGQAIDLIITHRIGLVPLVDGDGKLKGILNLMEILQLAMPRLMDMFDNLDFVHDFGALEVGQISPELLNQPALDFMKPAISVEQSCGLLRAAALMSQRGLRDLPIVDAQGRLVGLASWVDVGAAFLEAWSRA